MARNQKYQDGRYLSLAATDPSTPASGDPVLVGQIPGVAQVDEGDGGNAATATSVDTGGVYDLYYVAADTPKLSKKNTGVRFGYALEAVTAGATATIAVKVGY